MKVNGLTKVIQSTTEDQVDCEKTYATEAILITHIQVHEKSKQYKCTGKAVLQQN